MCDASGHAAGYELLIEDYTETNDGPTKSNAPVALGSQRFTEGQLSLTMYAKEFLAFRIWQVRTYLVGSEETNNHDE